MDKFKKYSRLFLLAFVFMMLLLSIATLFDSSIKLALPWRTLTILTNIAIIILLLLCVKGSASLSIGVSKENGSRVKNYIVVVQWYNTNNTTNIEVSGIDEKDALNNALSTITSAEYNKDYAVVNIIRL